MAQLACDLAIVKPICFTISRYKSGCFTHNSLLMFEESVLTCDEIWVDVLLLGKQVHPSQLLAKKSKLILILLLMLNHG